MKLQKNYISAFESGSPQNLIHCFLSQVVLSPSKHAPKFIHQFLSEILLTDRHTNKQRNWARNISLDGGSNEVLFRKNNGYGCSYCRHGNIVRRTKRHVVTTTCSARFWTQSISVSFYTSVVSRDRGGTDNWTWLQTVCRSSWYWCRLLSMPVMDCDVSSDLSSPGSSDASRWQNIASVTSESGLEAAAAAAAATLCIDGVSMMTCFDVVTAACASGAVVTQLWALSTPTRALL